MFSGIRRILRRIWNQIGLRRYRLKHRLQRLRRAWRYAYGSLSADDAQWVLIDCHDTAGWHFLLTLTVEDTLEQAREIFADHPELRRLIEDGCSRVGRKWESYNDDLFEARRWAIELAEGYASDEGITLIRIGDEVTTETEEATSDDRGHP
jgi:hypothetical protein